MLTPILICLPIDLISLTIPSIHPSIRSTCFLFTFFLPPFFFFFLSTNRHAHLQIVSIYRISPSVYPFVRLVSFGPYVICCWYASIATFIVHRLSNRLSCPCSSECCSPACVHWYDSVYMRLSQWWRGAQERRQTSAALRRQLSNPYERVADAGAEESGGVSPVDVAPAREHHLEMAAAPSSLPGEEGQYSTHACCSGGGRTAAHLRLCLFPCPLPCFRPHHHPLPLLVSAPPLFACAFTLSFSALLPPLFLAAVPTLPLSLPSAPPHAVAPQAP